MRLHKLLRARTLCSSRSLLRVLYFNEQYNFCVTKQNKFNLNRFDMIFLEESDLYLFIICSLWKLFRYISLDI